MSEKRHSETSPIRTRPHSKPVLLGISATSTLSTRDAERHITPSRHVFDALPFGGVPGTCVEVAQQEAAEDEERDRDSHLPPLALGPLLVFGGIFVAVGNESIGHGGRFLPGSNCWENINPSLENETVDHRLSCRARGLWRCTPLMI